MIAPVMARLHFEYFKKPHRKWIVGVALYLANSIVSMEIAKIDLFNFVVSVPALVLGMFFWIVSLYMLFRWIKSIEKSRLPVA